MISGEHAAVYAYGLVAARIGPGRRDQARAQWRRHVARRDVLEATLLRHGGEPPAAAPAYDVGTPPAGPGAAVALAVRVEDGVAAVAASAVAATAGGRRREAADALVAAARASARWSGRATSLPGG
jgi:hypothetical protein